MQTILKLLRDPIWQMIGVVVAVVAIFITSTQSGPGPKELVAIHVRQGGLIDQWMPGERTKVLIEGSNIDPQRAVADYFLLQNASSSHIAPQDFTTRLAVHPKKGTKLLRVQSCSQSFAQACSADGSTTPAGGAYVTTLWKLVEGSWTAEGPLINRDDWACVMVISEPLGEYARGSSLATLSARVKDYNFRSFDSLEAFAQAKKRWYHSLYTVVHFEALSVYWLVLLAATLMFASFRLLQLSLPQESKPTTQVLWQVSLAMLCVSTAEIMTDVFLNKKGNFLDQSLHAIVWPLLALHVVVLMVLVYRALRVRRMRPEGNAA